MRKMKTLLTKTNKKFTYPIIPRTGLEIFDRTSDSKILSTKQFEKKHKFEWNQPFTLIYDNKEFEMQYNFCTDPFCNWYGMPQSHFQGRKHRYRLSDSGPIDSELKSIFCNKNSEQKHSSLVTKSSSVVLSNWSIAEEVSRLANNNKVVDREPEYQFHKNDCTCNASPFTSPELFHKRGKSSSNSQKWQCKKCKKMTNTLPAARECFSYHQQRNDILPLFADLLLNRSPVKRACEVLKIGNSTYYKKLEILYQRCLEFLERHETAAFSRSHFDEMYLDTDYLQYHLNNVRRKGRGGQRYDNLEDKKLETYVAVTGEMFSRYILRADIAFNWDMPMEELWVQTWALKEHLLPYYSRANAHLRYSVYPQEPLCRDDKAVMQKYYDELEPILKREQYIDGLHVNQTYTSLAHFWLIKQMVNSDKWWINMDDDNSLKTAVLRAFVQEIQDGQAQCFITKVNQKNSKPKAFREHRDNITSLMAWAQIHYGRKEVNLYRAARAMLETQLSSGAYDEDVNIDGYSYFKKATKFINHPISTIDEGVRSIRCLTDASSLSDEELAKIIVNINSRVLKYFFSQVRRRLSIFERPLLTARRDRMSYIYANFDPMYGQYALTILRTFNNFCHPWTSSRDRDGKKEASKLTPAQRLGLTDKVFTMKDIIYFK